MVYTEETGECLWREGRKIQAFLLYLRAAVAEKLVAE
ncbi:hypothetical protein SPACI_049460 [Sporomusa acidovorans DSM 3132]|uniref:Uncharacterized protein n=1 Tax=Sporomusa acidovorans (strain ATCC 49682 / DSM 3132 / Mol) TaxID=1123286 RepID=A0ABZ3J9L6_SPOA4|nr:hypothetical protein SPACI_45920 [Sporomusa acidovorans DSM 3132]SDE31910.1 hypothetical protein SAMN04488499_101194 [Sporomusa acidovorans]